MMENKVLAVVAGEEVTEQDLNDFMENVPQDQQAYRSNPQFRQQYLEQLIALRMFTKQGEELKLDETEEFKKIMEGARKDILAQLMVSETIKDITVTDEEAKSYFEANKRRFVKGETVRAKHILTETSSFYYNYFFFHSFSTHPFSPSPIWNSSTHSNFCTSPHLLDCSMYL